MDAEATPTPRGRTVLMTTDTVGGVWTYSIELATALAARGWRVELASMGADPSDAQRRQAMAVPGLNLHASDLKLEWMDQPWRDVDIAGRWLLSLEHRLRPDVVHLNQFSFGALPWRAPTLLVAHSCVLSWWQAVHGEPAPAAWDTYRSRTAAGLHGASLVAAPTAAMLATLAPNHGWHGSGIVLRNGRDPRAWAPAAHKEPYVLSAGRMWDEAKNLAALESVAADLPWPVRVAGSCRAPDGGVRVPRNVQHLGELPPAQLMLQMARAAIYALPARYEPFGLSVLEAALCGCALVLGDIPSLRETWGDAAHYVPADDTQALQAAIARLVDDPALRTAHALAARRRALRLSRQRMARATLSAYARLLGGTKNLPDPFGKATTHAPGAGDERHGSDTPPPALQIPMEQATCA